MISSDRYVGRLQIPWIDSNKISFCRARIQTTDWFIIGQALYHWAIWLVNIKNIANKFPGGDLLIVFLLTCWCYISWPAKEGAGEGVWVQLPASFQATGQNIINWTSGYEHERRACRYARVKFNLRVRVNATQMTWKSLAIVWMIVWMQLC